MSVRPLEAVSLGGREIWPPFTIPSGIITVTPDLIQRVAEEVPIGLITTKSVGVAPRDGYPEPVFSQYSSDSLSTAVGLSNPGYQAWVEEVKEIYPDPGRQKRGGTFVPQGVREAWGDGVGHRGRQRWALWHSR